MRRARRADIGVMLEDLAQLLNLERAPARLECFDISHTAGEGTVASCVVYGPEGPDEEGVPALQHHRRDARR